MKHLTILSLALIIACASCSKKENQPRIFIFTDINIDSGDPDDRQSLVHLLWYADELQIEGIVPDRWNARGLEACELALAAYSKDFQLFKLGEKSFTDPRIIKEKLAQDRNDAIQKFHAAAGIANTPLYVLVWGNMELFGDALRQKPELAQNIRLITIGTDLMMEEYRQYIPQGWEVTEKPCEQYNWNGWGRNEIFNDPDFKDMWWLEINWTYEGMFTGQEPEEMYEKLSQYGALGQHMLDVTINEPWARYFRVGDTPTVLYVIDPDNNPADPTLGSWAGKFVKPFPQERPNYYTDESGPVEWDYANPCNTWENHVKMRDHAKSTLESKRPAMYDALLEKLEKIYN
jgi:hypothetical protein